MTKRVSRVTELEVQSFYVEPSPDQEAVPILEDTYTAHVDPTCVRTLREVIVTAQQSLMPATAPITRLVNSLVSYLNTMRSCGLSTDAGNLRRLVVVETPRVAQPAGAGSVESLLDLEFFNYVEALLPPLPVSNTRTQFLSVRVQYYASVFPSPIVDRLQ